AHAGPAGAIQLQTRVSTMLPIPGEIVFLLLTMVFDETFAALALASLYPLPDDRPREEILRIVQPTMITITGNDVEVQNLDGVAGSCALVVVTGQTSPENGRNDSFIVANNRFRARAPQPDLSAAFMFYFGRCVLQGNLISDDPVGSPPSA